MPHSLQILSDSYKRLDPVFAKRCRQLLRTLDHLKIAASNAITSGSPGPELFTALRDLLRNHTAFADSFKSRSQQLFFPQPEQILADLDQLDRLVVHAKVALSDENNKECLVALVHELIQ